MVMIRAITVGSRAGGDAHFVFFLKSGRWVPPASCSASWPGPPLCANARCCFRVTPPPHAAAPHRAPRRHVPFGRGYSEPLLGATAKRGPAPLRRKMEEEREGPGGGRGGGSTYHPGRLWWRVCRGWRCSPRLGRGREALAGEREGGFGRRDGDVAG